MYYNNTKQYIWNEEREEDDDELGRGRRRDLFQHNFAIPWTKETFWHTHIHIHNTHTIHKHSQQNRFVGQIRIECMYTFTGISILNLPPELH